MNERSPSDRSMGRHSPRPLSVQRMTNSSPSSPMPDASRVPDERPSTEEHPKRRHRIGHTAGAPTLHTLSRDLESLSREVQQFGRGAHRLPQLRSLTPRRVQLPAVSPRPEAVSRERTRHTNYNNNNNNNNNNNANPNPSSNNHAGSDLLNSPEPPSASSPSARTRDGRIRVVVRKRPMATDDVGADCIVVQPPNVRVAVTKQRVDLTEYEEGNDYAFDDAFDSTQRNADVFRACGLDLITTALEGGSASCFAYGQTGSGKTHTMIGSGEEGGLYILAAAELFERLPGGYEVYASLYEIYCNSLFDLLNSRAPVVVREDHNRRVNICGLSWHSVAASTALWALVSSGTDQRSTGSTSANERSSRSHAVLTIHVRNNTDPSFCGTLNFVDLAGSERAADTSQMDKQTRHEGAEINKSLLALKECIRALDEKKRHVPFRGSKLTEILRDSFTGNCRTVMIANISASSSNYEHTINTLRYAFRVKGLSVPVVAPSRARNAPRPLMPTGGDPSPRKAEADAADAQVRRKSRARPTSLGAVQRAKSTQRVVDEERLRSEVMARLKQDLGREIRQMMEERDQSVAKLQRENAELRHALMKMERRLAESWCTHCGTKMGVL